MPSVEAMACASPELLFTSPALPREVSSWSLSPRTKTGAATGPQNNLDHYVDAGERLAASYVNFYLANGAVIIPGYGVPEDEAAVRLFKVWPLLVYVSSPDRDSAFITT